jgi:hypothetical protein
MPQIFPPKMKQIVHTTIMISINSNSRYLSIFFYDILIKLVLLCISFQIKNYEEEKLC